mmetsp:Transcript_41771/g.94365  ORF Transcript_41771/g.94365 Transcript_41771/m.94365 type:complete len:225 (-) Transcript_41771:78-752(-)
MRWANITANERAVWPTADCRKRPGSGVTEGNRTWVPSNQGAGKALWSCTPHLRYQKDGELGAGSCKNSDCGFRFVRTVGCEGIGGGWYGGGAYGGALESAIIFVKKMLSPSIIASNTPPTAAERPAARHPPRAASTPPVAAPEMIEFHGSSFLRIATSEQSKVENRPPHTAKFPPIIGALALTAVTPPIKRSPRGELRAPLTLFHTPPPMAPIANAPPMSSNMR